MQGQPLDAIFWLKLVTVSGVLIAMLYGAHGVFSALKAKQSGFDQSSLQALAITFFLPVVVLVAIVAGLETQALAALLGTVAGFVLSRTHREE